MVLRRSSMMARRTAPTLRSVLLGSQRLSSPLSARWWALPRRVRVTEVDLDAQGGLDVGPAGHLAALVPGQRLDQMPRLAGQRRCDRGGGVVGVVAVGQRDGEGLAAGALHERRDRAAVGLADDQIALPVAGLAAVLDAGRALRDRLEIAQRAGLSARGGPGPALPAAPRQQLPGALGQAPGAAVVIAGGVDRLRADAVAL